MQNKAKRLRKGEIEILKVLSAGPKIYKEIAEALNWIIKDKESNQKISQPTLLSNYLKNLQKLGLITRDIDTRKYHAEKVSVEKLFYHDLLEFLSEQVNADLNVQEEGKKSIITSLLWLAVTDHKATEFKNELKKTLENPKNIVALDKTWSIIYEAWKNCILLERRPKERQIIIKYKKSLLEAYNLLRKQQLPSKELTDLEFAIAHEKLKREFPELEKIPKEAVHIEATRRLRHHQDLEGKWDSEIVSNLENLIRQMDREEQRGNVRNSIDSEKEQKLCEIAIFLKDKKNRRIYEGYLRSLERTPKTLVVVPALGFRGYLDELKELYPEKAAEVERDLWEKQEQILLDAIEKLEKSK
jgi:DNA-binding HxlR family transcriptional regulator